MSRGDAVWRRGYIRSALADQLELGLAADPPADAHVLAAGGFQVFQILLQRSLVELGQELGLNGHVEATDVIDELTFGHGWLTFTKAFISPVWRTRHLIKSTNFVPGLEPIVMTQLQPNPIDSEKPQADDPLSHLHKMSTTAGLGTTEYVAVNGMAVVTLIMGVASALSLFDPVLLTIPVITVILAILSIRQIRRSNGTQTGTGLAILGLVLGLLFTGLVGGREVIQITGNREDENAINDLISQLDQNTRASKFDAAYGLFTAKFTSRVNQQDFSDLWKKLVKSGRRQYGGLKSIQSNGRMVFDVVPDTGQKEAVGMTIMDITRAAQPQRIEMFFKQQPDGTWKIDDIPLLFPTQAPEPPKKK